MGLTLHVHSHTPAALGLEAVCDLVGRWRAIAQTFVAADRIDEVFETSRELEDLGRFATNWISVPHPTEANTAAGVAVTPLEGCIFLVRLGSGCEPFVLGLCRYPAMVTSPVSGESLPTEMAGWRLVSSCKTHYAGNHGWEHFRRCHLAAVDLAGAGGALGIEVRLEDEGNYWPNRDEAALRSALDCSNGLIAAVAGGLHDEERDIEETGNETTPGDLGNKVRRRTESPIFAHPRFEHLEAEGLARTGAEKIAEALRTIKNATRDTPPGRGE